MSSAKIKVSDGPQSKKQHENSSQTQKEVGCPVYEEGSSYEHALGL